MESNKSHLNKLNKVKRICQSADFQAFRDPVVQNLKLSSPYFLIFFKSNGYEFARMAVIVSKRVSKKSPLRNLIKRLVRETFRKLSLTHLDFLIIARSKIVYANNQEICQNLKQCLIDISMQNNPSKN